MWQHLSRTASAVTASNICGNLFESDLYTKKVINTLTHTHTHTHTHTRASL